MADPAAGVGQAQRAPLDDRLDQLISERFAAIVARHPVIATFVGLREHDHRLSDGTRAAVLGDIDAARRFLAEIEGLDATGLSPANQLERDLALHHTRHQLFSLEVHRLWERRASAANEIGEAVFLLFARQHRPLVERLGPIAARLEAAPRLAAEQRDRLGEQPVRLWNELEIQAASSLPMLFGEVVTAAKTELGEASRVVQRLERAAAEASRALEEYVSWLRGRLERAGDDFALGADDYATLIELREFDGLDTDQILEIGLAQLADNKAARRQIAAEIDGAASEQEVLDRIKSDHPPDFDAALAAYRRAMDEARLFVIDQGIATMPPTEQLAVVPTPEFLRKVIPFAAYFPPAKFEAVREGVYIVTPSVDGAAGALREHNYASIYNTGIHEAYPGHHQQLSAALDHPSLLRLLVDAPEFVEGWAMYCEQMMREQGFDTAPERRLMMYTDAIWRACRIILDVRLHRREIGFAEAIDFLVEHTGFERPNATAEVRNYTSTPTYQLSYLLGKVLLLRLRADEQRRLGDGFSLRDFHDALLREGNMPISFHRRLLADGAE